MNVLTNTARDWTLNAYYMATLPVRLGANALTSAQGRAPISVLFYHRVADKHQNAWTIPTQEFERQMHWIKGHFDVISLRDAQLRMESGCNRRPAVCLTFDDGYADNCEFAIPLLQRLSIPATYFISLDLIKQGTPFPHDVLAGEPLAVNTVAQIREMASQGIDIGLHTRTHCDLGKLHHPECLHEEIYSARGEMRSLFGVPVDYFAFPYGQRQNITSAAIKMVQRAGFRGFCSAYGGYNWPGDDPYHLQRIHGDTSFIRLKNWLTVDPRKVSIERFALPDETKVEK
jgi:peptidoglycan/xylan/chitin deacetylase (PgdA/CDA1 family)